MDRFAVSLTFVGLKKTVGPRRAVIFWHAASLCGHLLACLKPTVSDYRVRRCASRNFSIVYRPYIAFGLTAAIRETANKIAILKPKLCIYLAFLYLKDCVRLFPVDCQYKKSECFVFVS